MTLSLIAQLILDEILDDSNRTMLVALPHGLPADERAWLIDHHSAIRDELQAAGYPIEVLTGRAAGGEVLALAMAAGPFAE